MTDWEVVREIGRTLPEVEEGFSYRTPALKVRKRLMCRVRDAGTVLAVRVDPGERELLIASKPDVYFVTPHYEAWPWMLVRLPDETREDLVERVTDAWMLAAPAKLVNAYADSLATD